MISPAWQNLRIRGCRAIYRDWISFSNKCIHMTAIYIQHSNCIWGYELSAMELKANKTMADFVLSSLLISLLLKFYVWFAFAKRPLILSLPSARTLRDSYRTCLSNLQEFRCNTVMYIRRHTTTKWSLPRKRQEKQSSCHDISIFHLLVFLFSL